MADSLDGNAKFTITSFSQGHLPIGVNFTRQATQFVYVGAPVHGWTAHKVGTNKYRLTIGGYNHVGVEGGKLVASIHPQFEKLWEITYQVAQNAYTIALADQPHLGWTIPAKPGPHNHIVIGPIISTGSQPPQFLPTQLFLIRGGAE